MRTCFGDLPCVRGCLNLLFRGSFVCACVKHFWFGDLPCARVKFYFGDLPCACVLIYCVEATDKRIKHIRTQYITLEFASKYSCRTRFVAGIISECIDLAQTRSY